MSRLWQTEFSGFLGVPEPSNVEFAVTSTCTAPSITQSFPGEAVHFGMNLALRTVVLASNCGAQLDFHSILSNFLKSNSETELLTVSNSGAPDSSNFARTKVHGLSGFYGSHRGRIADDCGLFWAPKRRQRHPGQRAKHIQICENICLKSSRQIA